MSRLSLSEIVWVSFKSTEHQAWVLDIDEEDDEALVKWETTGMTAWVPRTSIHEKLETRRRKKGATFCSFQDFQEHTTNTLWKQVSVGSRLSVYWKDDDQYYNANVVKQRGTSSMFRLEYDDGDNEWLDLSREQLCLLSNDKTTTSNESWKDVSVGCQIAVYWKDDDKYYNATVVNNPGSASASPGAVPSIFSLQYDDGDKEQLNLSQHCFQLLDEKPIDTDDADIDASTNADTNADTCSSSIDKNLWEQVSDGSRIAMYWKDDATYYKATVLKQRGSMCSMKYDDGERERLDMSKEIFTLLDQQQRCRTNVHDKSSETTKRKSSHTDYHNKLTTREQKRPKHESRKTKRQQEEKNALSSTKSKHSSRKQGTNTAAEKDTVSKADEYVATPQKAQREKNELSAAYRKEQEPTLETTGLDPSLPKSTELPQSTLSGCSPNQSRTNTSSRHDRAPENDHEGNDTSEITGSTTVQICTSIDHEDASCSSVESSSKELLPVSCSSSSSAELLLEKNRLLLRKRLTGPRKKRILRGYEMDLSTATAATESF
jgi:hypothetical protein